MNLQQAVLHEQEHRHRLEELLRLKEEYFFSEEEGVYRGASSVLGKNYAYCPKCMHEKDKAIPLGVTDPEEKEMWSCAACGWNGWSRGAAKRMRENTLRSIRTIR